MNAIFGEEYHEKFDTQAFLKCYYTSPTIPFKIFPLPHLYSFYQSLDNKSLKILEVGAGPCIAYVISAAPYASEIILSEYTEQNCKAIQQWLDKSADAHDWKPFFKHIVVDVEGGEETDIAAREEMLQSSIKAVIPCDVAKDMPLPTEYMKQYDVVLSILCLENACQTRDDYVPVLKRLAHLLKPDGKLFLYHVERVDSSEPALYSVEGQWYKNIRLSPKFIIESLKAAGFNDISRVSLDLPSEAQPCPYDPVVFAVYTATYTPVYT